MLIIVESPTKAKKIPGFVSAKVIATIGHFKDLPKDSFGIDLSNYQPDFTYDPKKMDMVKRLREAAKGEDVYIASDPDREGYAIGVFVYQEIKSVAKSTFRAEIHEITEKGVKEALSKAIPFDKTNSGYFDAFLGRRVTDRLMGYILSPLACQDLKGKFSVGRVQSPAVRLIVDREREIKAFKPAPYWVPSIQLEKDGIKFSATHLSKTFTNHAEALAVHDKIRGVQWALAEKIDQKETKQSPKAPFTTVELQSTASTQLKISPETTMSLAQGLFDCGLITYHRTDSVRIADEFIEEIRGFVGKEIGARYVPATLHRYKSKASQADAHEAVRPTKLHSLSSIPALIAKENLTPDHARVYELIFKRAVASQMSQALYDSTIMTFDVAGEKFKATGRVQKFDGFLSLYKETLGEEEKEGKPEEEAVQTLPAITQGESVTKTGDKLEEKKTKPPARFTNAALLKELEDLGIGRPSTYAAILKNIKDREYVKLDGQKYVPLDKGYQIIDYLAAKQPWAIEYEMTARMEEYLDKVAEKNGSWQSFAKGVHSKMGYATPTAKGEGKPSDASLDYARKLSEKFNAPIPASALEKSGELSAWIDSVRKANGLTTSTGKTSGSNGKSSPGTSEPIGACPVCKKPVKESPKAYSCTANCGFTLWRNKLSFMGKDDITPTIAKQLLKGPTVVKGLKSKNGTISDLKCTLENNPQYGWGVKVDFKK